MDWSLVADNFPILVNQAMQINNVTDILGRCILCFTSDPNKANSLIELLQTQYFKVDQKLNQVNNKLDRLLGAPEKKIKLHLKEASLHHKFRKKQESADELKAANDAAKDAFNLANDIEGWTKATEFRMTCAIMKFCFDFTPKSKAERQILGETLKLHFDDLREKIDERKNQELEEANSASFGSGKTKKKEAKKSREQYDLAEGKLLNAAYCFLSESLKWTNPKKRIPIKEDHLTFDVLPKYVPIGEGNAVNVMVKQEPNISVKVYRKVVYNVEKPNKKDKAMTITPTISLVWSIDDDTHQAILPNLMLELDPYPITISKSKLDGFRRGGMKLDLNRTLSLNPGVLNLPRRDPWSNFPPLAHQPMSEPGNTLEIEDTPKGPKASKDVKRSRCSICRERIKDRELAALGVSFHPTCFNCSQCGDNLSGDDIRFMADDEKAIFCLDCYNKKFGKLCYGCQTVIEVAGVTGRSIIAGERNYHPGCYCCEECGAKLGPGGEKCYPQNDRFLCLRCACDDSN